MGMECMVADTPRYLAFVIVYKPVLALHTGIHDVVSADCTGFNLHVQRPKGNQIPFLQLYYFFVLHVFVYLRG